MYSVTCHAGNAPVQVLAADVWAVHGAGVSAAGPGQVLFKGNLLFITDVSAEMLLMYFGSGSDWFLCWNPSNQARFPACELLHSAGSPRF